MFRDHMQLLQMSSLWMELKARNICVCVWGRLWARLGSKVGGCPAGSCLAGVHRRASLSLSSRVRGSCSRPCLHGGPRAFPFPSFCLRSVFTHSLKHLLARLPRPNQQSQLPSLSPDRRFPGAPKGASQGQCLGAFDLNHRMVALTAAKCWVTGHRTNDHTHQIFCCHLSGGERGKIRIPSISQPSEVGLPYCAGAQRREEHKGPHAAVPGRYFQSRGPSRR